MFYKLDKFSLEPQFSLIPEQVKRVKHHAYSCKINCCFRAFLTSSFCARLSICSFHTFHFRTFYLSRSAITGSRGNSEKDGDGLIAIPGRLAGCLFLTAPLLSFRHYNPPAYNFPARCQADVTVAVFSGVAVHGRAAVPREEWGMNLRTNARAVSLRKGFNGESRLEGF